MRHLAMTAGTVAGLAARMAAVIILHVLALPLLIEEALGAVCAALRYDPAAASWPHWHSGKQ